MNDPHETTLYDGRTALGLIKPVSGAFEVFTIGEDCEPEYLAKATTRREASDMIHQHAARSSAPADGRGTP